MLTRLRVSGFKNLVNVDVRFGPFTCIGGANGVGKSNLLDALTFLSALADSNLVDAAMRVRDHESPIGDVAAIFHRHGSFQQTQMSFIADMIIPPRGTDDLGQEAIATTTFVRYTLHLRLRDDSKVSSNPPIEIVSETLTHVRAGEYKEAIGFKADITWIDSVIRGRRSALNYISTDEQNHMILVHQDNGPGKSSGGRTRRLSTGRLPRTVLSSANALENPTAMLVRLEMRSWKLLQLEPSSLRRPDPTTAPSIMDIRGSHLPATLWSLAHIKGRTDEMSEQRVYGTVASRLAELLHDVTALRVDLDERRDTLVLSVAAKDGTFHPARALSDGTLRFLALAVLEIDPRTQGILCLEEPENGIHPDRIPAILDLLRDIAVDVTEPVSDSNPLRQVIINTHSPSVVLRVPEDSLLIAETVRSRNEEGGTYGRVIFSALPDTWRERLNITTVPRGNLLAYLNPRRSEDEESISTNSPTRSVQNNPAIQSLIEFGKSA